MTEPKLPEGIERELQRGHSVHEYPQEACYFCDPLRREIAAALEARDAKRDAEWREAARMCCTLAPAKDFPYTCPDIRPGKIKTLWCPACRTVTRMETK